MILIGFLYAISKIQYITSSRLVKLICKKSVLIGMILSISPIFLLNSRIIVYVANFFGKKGDLSRKAVWNKSLFYIRKNLLFGLGREPRSMTIRKIYQSHCHNIILEHLYIGGIIGLLLFVVLVILFIPQTNNAKNNRNVIIFSATILCYFMTAGIDWLLTNQIPMSIFIFNFYLISEKPNDNLLLKSPNIYQDK